jgi:hypothetical protein
VSIGLEQQVAGPETQVDYAGDREGGPRVAVAATEPWFLIGRLDGREFRVVRADRLAVIIGPDYREWWLYSDEAFDSKLSAALALTDILDPAGRRQKPRASLLVLEHDLGAALARLQPTQREAMAAAIHFMIDRILLPFAETTSFDSWQAVDRTEGKPWTGEDFDDGIELLKTLQALLEAKRDTSIIIINTEPGANPGCDCGDRSDRAS